MARPIGVRLHDESLTRHKKGAGRGACKDTVTQSYVMAKRG